MLPDVAIHVESESSSSAAAFFDLDKTIISRSSTLAFGEPFYRHGLISKSDAIRGAFAQLVFRLAGASHHRMERAAERGYRLAACFAYSDSITDLPLLEAVGHPRAVNPDRALRKVARRRGWPVLQFATPRATAAADVRQTMLARQNTPAQRM
jgi:phosphoserine phosphatase